METEACWLQRFPETEAGSEVSEPCRINAGTLLPLKFEVLTLSTSSLLLKEVALMQRLDCSREVAGYASWIQLIAAMVIAYHSASSHHGTLWFLGVGELNPSLHTHRGFEYVQICHCYPRVADLCPTVVGLDCYQAQS